MRKFIIVTLLSCFSFAHDLHHKVEQNQATVVTFSFGGGADFSYQQYEVYAPNAKLPFAVGRTDSNSRVIFIPNQSGVWHVKAVSEDGHGASIDIEVDEHMQLQGYSQSFYERFQKIFVGVALIFALFALLHFINRRKK